jgi:hypothetical protein
MRRCKPQLTILYIANLPELLLVVNNGIVTLYQLLGVYHTSNVGPILACKPYKLSLLIYIRSLDSLRLALSLFCLSLKYPCLFIKYLEVERACKMAFAASVINLGHTARLR